MSNENEDKWSAEGITFETVGLENKREVMAHLKEAFFPDEPMYRSTKLYEGRGFIDRIIKHVVRKGQVEVCLKHHTSIVAKNKEGKIIGARTGEIFNEVPREPDWTWMARMPSKFFPKKLITVGGTMKFMDLIRYGKKYCLEDVPEATKVYVGMSLSVTSEGRGKGLGTELLKRSMAFAKTNGCTHMYILATSKYSQAIFDKMGFDILHEYTYDDYKTTDGSGPFFGDMREHKAAKVVLFDLSKFNETDYVQEMK